MKKFVFAVLVIIVGGIALYHYEILMSLLEEQLSIIENKIIVEYCDLHPVSVFAEKKASGIIKIEDLSAPKAEYHCFKGTILFQYKKSEDASEDIEKSSLKILMEAEKKDDWVKFGACLVSAISLTEGFITKYQQGRGNVLNENSKKDIKKNTEDFLNILDKYARGHSCKDTYQYEKNELDTIGYISIGSFAFKKRSEFSDNEDFIKKFTLCLIGAETLLNNIKSPNKISSSRCSQLKNATKILSDNISSICIISQ